MKIAGLAGLAGFCILFYGIPYRGGAQEVRAKTLDSLFAPLRVGTPLSDAYIGLSLTESGEVRYYNYGEQAESGAYYLSSRDGGLSWEKSALPKGIPYADVQSPVSGEYLRLVNLKGKVFCIRTQGGLEGGRTITKVSDTPMIMIKPPVFVRHNQRVIVAGHWHRHGSFTFVSDDDGMTWKASNIVSSPEHRKGGFHQGIRWNHGAVEPTVIELKDGTLYMLMRTSQDYLYQSYSYDGGLTWQPSQPSFLYGTITMPTIGRLKDGRLLLVWCNTTPLPERAEADGVWEDVFTNRDVIHMAVSEDEGKSWTGMRELYLNPWRNDSLYALRGGGIDRGVQQSQFVEVKPGKILVAVGQHPLHRALLLVDVNWLYERERFCDFSDSLKQWSVFNYRKGIKGHCAYNRIPGCEIKPHPEQRGKSILNICHLTGTALVSDIRGALWNFPALKKGQFSAGIRIPAGSEGITLLLNDHWFNPCDTVARYYAMYELEINRARLGIKDDSWHELKIEWDMENKGHTSARVWVDGRKLKFSLPLKNEAPSGICYVHLFSAGQPDPVGVDIEWVRSGTVE